MQQLNAAQASVLFYAVMPEPQPQHGATPPPYLVSQQEMGI